MKMIQTKQLNFIKSFFNYVYDDAINL